MKMVKTNMREQVHQLLKSRILDQTYALGEKINLYNIAQELGISNSPLREAVTILESENLVTFTPNVGPRVVQITASLYKDVVETTVVLLVGAFDTFIERDMLGQLEDHMKKSIAEQKRLAVENCSDTQFVSASIQFDFGCLKQLNNALLSSLYDKLADILFLIILYDHQNFDTNRWKLIDEHERILDYVIARDFQGLKSELKLHYTKTLTFSGE